MTWPPDSTAARAAGFSLVEMIVVLVILGLALALIVTRGPQRSHALEISAAASEVAETLRLARARAIASNRPMRVVVDTTEKTLTTEGGAARALPAAYAMAVQTIAGAADERRAVIGFAPDGSSSGGRIALTLGPRRVWIDVDWLTGRVSIADAP
jgi:general secretion pathway protein H